MSRQFRIPFVAFVCCLVLSDPAEGQVTVPRGRPRLNTARTSFVGDNGQNLRGPYTSTEWTSAAPADQIANMRNLGFNAVHLYAEVFSLNYPTSGNPPGYNVAAFQYRSSNNFSDPTWSNGPARLGYGNDGELTKVASNRQWTTYFRRQFYVPNPTQVTALNARLTRDDAAVIFLNGAEIWRDTNFASGVITNQTPAVVALGTPDETKSWTAPQQFFTPDTRTPGLPIDYHCIGDGEHMYLFFTGDDGNFYRSKTAYAQFPKGFSNPVVAMRGTRSTVFEGSFTYKIKGTDKYLTCVEALSPTRFYRAYVADKLDGEWYPVEGFDTFEKPFAGIRNMTFEEGVEPWSGQVSHGEMIREGNDERMILDPDNLMFLYQGIANADNRGDYGSLPYKLGLLRAVKEQ